jgi:tetratricopeptide (TPR) repeat protein
MFRKSTHGAALRRSFAARAALAMALAGGIVLGTALPVPALAKDKSGTPKPEGNSKAFADAYGPFVAIVNNPAGDFAAAKAMIPAITAAAQNETDKSTLGTALIALGTKLKDTSIQTQGIHLALASGKANPAQVGLFHFFLGQAAYEAKNYTEARTELLAAVQAGYTGNDARPVIAETYFGGGQPAEGLKYLSDTIKQDTAAGKTIPRNWLLRGLKVAYEAKLAPQATEYSVMLVKAYPTQQSWLDSLQVIQSLNPFDAQSELDLLRLMRATGALKERRDYIDYINTADPRRMANEVLPVLDEALKAGVFTTTDAVYKSAKATADGRAAADRAEAPGLVADAKSAADGATAQGAGDAFFSLGDYAKATEMYKLALDKGVKDRDMIETRLGIAQTDQGQYDAARASFRQVNGARAPIAAMWLAYVDTKAAPPAAPAAPPAA